MIRIIFFIFIIVLLAACREDNVNKYSRLARKELASGKKVDSIFLGIYFGMTSKQFFLHCWQLNKKGILTDGKSNTAVLYKLGKNELNYPASMNFFPQFKLNKIHNMRVMYNYNDWAPWNKQLASEKLLTDVLNLYKKWYPAGNPFLIIEDKKRGIIYVKVDGNRRITIGRYDDMHVKADFTDLSVEHGTIHN